MRDPIPQHVKDPRWLRKPVILEVLVQGETESTHHFGKRVFILAAVTTVDLKAQRAFVSSINWSVTVL